MRVSDYELTTLAAGLPPPDGDFDRVLTPMARELIAAWEPIPVMGSPSRAMLYYRLRTTAEALRAFVDSRRESGWAIAAGKNAGPALNKALPDARAVLAQLEKEGLA